MLQATDQQSITPLPRPVRESNRQSRRGAGGEKEASFFSFFQTERRGDRAMIAFELGLGGDRVRGQSVRRGGLNLCGLRPTGSRVIGIDHGESIVALVKRRRDAAPTRAILPGWPRRTDAIRSSVRPMPSSRPSKPKTPAKASQP